MRADELKLEQAKIDQEVKRIAESMGLEAVYDGVISPDHYVARPIKVSWVLREPHDSGGDYDYKSAIIDGAKRNHSKRHRYFDPMRYLEYSLDHGFPLWNDIPNSDEDINVSRLLLNTALTNINKIVGGARVDYGTFWDYVAKFSQLVQKQIEVAAPNVIVASGTIDFFKDCGFLDNAISFPKTYRNYYAVGDRIILDCYHLGQTTITQEAFCDDIILAVQDATSRGFLNASSAST
jgi:hypothetical protein